MGWSEKGNHDDVINNTLEINTNPRKYKFTVNIFPFPYFQSGERTRNILSNRSNIHASLHFETAKSLRENK